MRCFHTGCSVSNGGALFRVNDKGRPGIWACRDHMPRVIPEDIDQIVRSIECRCDPALGRSNPMCPQHGIAGQSRVARSMECPCCRGPLPIEVWKREYRHGVAFCSIECANDKGLRHG